MLKNMDQSDSVVRQIQVKNAVMSWNLVTESVTAVSEPLSVALTADKGVPEVFVLMRPEPSV